MQNEATEERDRDYSENRDLIYANEIQIEYEKLHHQQAPLWLAFRGYKTVICVGFPDPHVASKAFC